MIETHKPKRKRHQSGRSFSTRTLLFLMAIGLALPIALIPLLNHNAGQSTDLLWMGWISFWIIFISYRLVTWFLFGEGQSTIEDVESELTFNKEHLDSD
ncbi:MAG: hypothetical protein ACPG7F_06190 [Aggregatilineales bacterium]